MIISMYCCREIQNLALDAELSTTADLMNGRIVLVDDSFKILKDTFGLSRGKTLVVSDVLKAFDGGNFQLSEPEEKSISM